MQMCPICENGVLLEDKESLDSGFCSCCGEMSYFQAAEEIVITKENIFKYYKYLKKEELNKLDFDILITDSVNIAIRNDDCNEYIDTEGNLYSCDDEDLPKNAKLRYAVEYCYSPTCNEDDIEEYGLDYNYFDSEEEANKFIENTVLIPSNSN